MVNDPHPVLGDWKSLGTSSLFFLTLVNDRRQTAVDGQSTSTLVAVVIPNITTKSKFRCHWNVLVVGGPNKDQR